MVSKESKDAFQDLRQKIGVIPAQRMVHHNIKENFINKVVDLLKKEGKISKDEFEDFKWLAKYWGKF